MPVEFQNWITRTDLRSNPTKIYIFGDNDIRKGFGGQAKEMRGEPNALGIRTKRFPSYRDVAYWSDADFMFNCEKIVEDLKLAFEYLRAGGTVVFPSQGIGGGLSRMDETAPLTYAWLCGIIEGMVNEFNQNVVDTDRNS